MTHAQSACTHGAATSWRACMVSLLSAVHYCCVRSMQCARAQQGARVLLATHTHQPRHIHSVHARRAPSIVLNPPQALISSDIAEAMIIPVRVAVLATSSAAALVGALRCRYRRGACNNCIFMLKHTVMLHVILHVRKESSNHACMRGVVVPLGHPHSSLFSAAPSPRSTSPAYVHLQACSEWPAGAHCQGAQGKAPWCAGRQLWAGVARNVFRMRCC